jgi:hypothetical protein
MRAREGLIARVRQIRMVATTDTVSSPAPADTPSTLQDLERRIEHLEGQLQGLQDSVHRENVRLDGRVSDLESRTEPAALAVALSRDARERGL